MAFGGLKGTLTGNSTSITPSNALSGSVSVAVGDLAWVTFAEQIALTATTVSDNLGNTYTAQNAGTLSTATSGRSYWSYVTVAGTLTTVTVVASASTNNYSGIVVVIEGPFAASPLDANPANITSDITSPFTCPATGTLAQASEVVVAWGVRDTNTAWAATSPNLLGGQANAIAPAATIGYQAVAATTTVSPAFTAAANPSFAVLGTASFKAVAAAALPETIQINQAVKRAAFW